MRATISAGEYEQGFRPDHRGCVVEAAHRAAVGHLDLRRDDRVLDLGCGAGPLMQLLSQAGVAVVGIDYSERALALARDALPGRWFVRANATTLPFPDRSFDRIATLGMLGYVSGADLSRALPECARVLKPGGVLLICTGRRLNAIPVLVGRVRRRLQRRACAVHSLIHPARAYRRELRRLGFSVQEWVQCDAAPSASWGLLARSFLSSRWFRAEKGV